MNSQNNQDDEYEVKLYKRALNFLNSPRHEVEHKPAATSFNHVSNPASEEHHKGTVTDPEHDARLKENKEKREKEQEHQEGEQSDAREAEIHKKKVEERFEHLQKMDNDARKLTSRPVEAAYVLSPKSPAPKSLAPSTKPVGIPKSPVSEEVAPPKASFTYKPKPLSKSLSPNVPKNIAETTPAVPRNEVPKGMGQEEADLRFHPKHGPMVQRLLGPKPSTPEKMNGVYKALNLANQLENHKDTYRKLQAALEKAETIIEKNAIQIKISQMASLIANLGGLNKNG